MDSLKQEVESAWFQFITLLKANFDPIESEAWIQKMHLINFNEDQLTFGGLDLFFSNYLKQHHATLLKQLAFKSFTNVGLKPNFTLKLLNQAPSAQSIEAKCSEKNLNPQQHFNNFVNGSNSSIAFAAAEAVAENIKNSRYNPLFLCGGVGLGKTHLLQAIGNHAMQQNSEINVLYCSAEQFTNEFIEGIRFGKIQNLRNKYRYLDLLLIDDIQFLEYKDSTQEEFFHTFNTLIQQQKQIALTADRFPTEIKNIEERLISRFSAGMVAKIEPPDFETKVAIILNELEFMNIQMPEEIIHFIAHSIKSNVREIKGVLIHLEAKMSLLNQPITMSSTISELQEKLDLSSKPIQVEDILQKVNKAFGVKVSDILSESREREISQARHIAMYIARDITNSSYPMLGKKFNKNHTAVIQAYKKIKKKLAENPELRHTVVAIIKDLTI